ncbi:MAG: ComEC/Rec2 family competence protein [Terriglobales bacterium]
MYNGIEIDMLSLGDADCILVSFWSGLSVYRVLIDGGNKGDAPAIRAFLRGLGISSVDELLSTHLHDDHSGGLIELLADETLTFGKLWCHIPHWHVEGMDKVYAALKAAGASDEAMNIRKSLETVASLFNAAKKRGIPHEEPFKGKRIGNLEACSPTEEFYTGLVAEFTDAGKIRAEDAAQLRYDVQTRLEEAMAKGILADALSGSSLLSEPHTTPENESSTVTGTMYDGKVLLFTSDAGTSALTNVASSYNNVAGVQWMQIPHHGSRRNLTESLIETFAPKVAYVSALGNDKHPRRAVVSAFKKLGSFVFSTHYPRPGHLRYYVGSVPSRTGYYAATPLWDEGKLAKLA